MISVKVHLSGNCPPILSGRIDIPKPAGVKWRNVRGFRRDGIIASIIPTAEC